jgi:hypothetical protein
VAVGLSVRRARLEALWGSLWAPHNAPFRHSWKQREARLREAQSNCSLDVDLNFGVTISFTRIVDAGAAEAWFIEREIDYPMNPPGFSAVGAGICSLGSVPPAQTESYGHVQLRLQLESCLFAGKHSGLRKTV